MIFEHVHLVVFFDRCKRDRRFYFGGEVKKHSILGDFLIESDFVLIGSLQLLELWPQLDLFFPSACLLESAVRANALSAIYARGVLVPSIAVKVVTFALPAHEW